MPLAEPDALVVPAPAIRIGCDVPPGLWMKTICPLGVVVLIADVAVNCFGITFVRLPAVKVGLGSTTLVVTETVLSGSSFLDTILLEDARTSSWQRQF